MVHKILGNYLGKLRGHFRRGFLSSKQGVTLVAHISHLARHQLAPISINYAKTS